jgi:hypothetical protein
MAVAANIVSITLGECFPHPLGFSANHAASADGCIAQGQDTPPKPRFQRGYGGA